MEWILTELIGSAMTSSNNLVDKILESLVPLAFYIIFKFYECLVCINNCLSSS